MLAVLGWLAAVGLAYFGWQRSTTARRRAVRSAARRAVSLLGESMADCAGAFDWHELILRLDSHHQILTAHRRDGSGDAIEAWTVELHDACREFERRLTAFVGAWSAAEVHAQRDGEVHARMTITHGV
ncbi:MAG: hypothetical protein M3Y89_14710 [Actinomycetota bacterium]|nr:hypothetical protein [Actinomycetota bacterium]